MSVSIKTAQEIELMRESGHLLEKVHDGLIPYIKPGMSTKEIDRIGEDMIILMRPVLMQSEKFPKKPSSLWM